MIMILLVTPIIFLIPMLLLITHSLISKKKNLNQEKMSPFECGFDPLSLSRLPFSIQFFLLSMIFLIFDIEITILIPLTNNIFMNSFSTLFISLFFLSILLIGLYFEFLDNSLEWKL